MQITNSVLKYWRNRPEILSRKAPSTPPLHLVYLHPFKASVAKWHQAFFVVVVVVTVIGLFVVQISFYFNLNRTILKREKKQNSSSTIMWQSVHLHSKWQNSLWHYWQFNNVDHPIRVVFK